MKALETNACKYNTLLCSFPITFENVKISLAYELSHALSGENMIHEFCLFVGLYISILTP